MKSNQIVVALDGMGREEALTLAWTLASSVWGFKVNDLLLTYGLDIIRDLKCLGRNVFADPKLHDIPQTVANCVTRIADAGADLITVHASGGKDMIQAAVEAATDAKIIAVTALTSMDEPTIQEVYCRSVEETVWDLSHLAVEAGVHGIVCASGEVAMLKHLNVIKVIPGIRTVPTPDDQRRTGVGQGGDLFVVGRPITQAKDPIQALNQLLTGDILH